MDWNELMPIISRSRAAAMLGALGLLVSAAPEDSRLALDPSAFAEEGCLAPAFAEAGCSYAGFVERDSRNHLSASAALLEPQMSPEQEPSRLGAVRLELDLSGLFDFWPEVVRPLPPRRNRGNLPLRIAAGSERVTACVAAGRHRPDRSQCARSASGRRR
jgi:hypothetical protein